MRFLPRILAAGLLAAPLALTVLAQEDGEAVTASMAVAPDAAQPGQVVELKLTISVSDPWHIFGNTPGSAGQQQLKLETKLPEGVEAVGEWKWPQHETVFEGYEVQVYNAGDHVFTRKVKITSAKGPISFKTDVTYQACNPEFCGPIELVQLTADLQVGATAAAAATATATAAKR